MAPVSFCPLAGPARTPGSDGRIVGTQPVRLCDKGPHLFFADYLLLFAEVSEHQICTIMDVHKISLSKSSIMFSKNANRLLPNSQQRIGWENTWVSLPSRVLDKVESRLNGWKPKILSMAGRPILAQSVITTLPLYPMQPTRVVGNRPESRTIHLGNKKIHLVNWETVTQSF